MALRAAIAGVSILAPDAMAADNTHRQLSHTETSQSESVGKKIKETIPAYISPEQLDASIRDVEMRLAPGGGFAKKLEDPRTSRAEVDKILTYINKVIEQIEIMKVMPEQYHNQKEAQKRRVPPKKYFHGSGAQTFHTIDTDGTEKPLACSGYYVSFGGNSYFATANHCVEGTKEQPQFVTLGYEKADIAVRFEPAYMGPALAIDESLTDADLQGRMTVIQGTRLGVPFTRTSFLIKMSEPLYEKTMGASHTLDKTWLSRQAASTFVMLMQPGDSTRDFQGIAPPQGMSGSNVGAWVSGGYRAGLTFYGIRILDEHQSALPQTGLNSPMGLVAGIDALKDVCAEARAKYYDAQNRFTEEAVGGGWTTRVKDNR